VAIDHTAALRQTLRVSGLAGTSRALADVLRQIAVAAPVPVSLLITGESGTGKTAVARAVHDSSPRASGPFVDLNCSAIPETLFESELFGAEKGAHSTATRRMEGKIDAARGGTLLLDEVGDLPLPVQGKLLTFTWLHNPPSDFMVVALGLGIVELENGVRVTGQLKIAEPVIGMDVVGRVERVREEGYNHYFGLVFYPA